MEPILLSQLLKGIARPQKDCLVKSVVYDSRQAEEGSLFLALKGERTNGQLYAARALEKGAVFVLTEDAIPDIPASLQAVVPDVLSANIAMSANFRARYGLDVIAVTGSVGKTTTKDFIRTVLSSFVPTLKSAGNRNNELGMPRTVYSFDKSYKYAVLEMGTEHAGDISKLSKAALPKAACITCIGVSHLERFGTRKNIFKAKMEICDGMDKDGFLVLNADDDFLKDAKSEKVGAVYRYGIKNTSADVTATDIERRGRSTRFTIKDAAYGSFSRLIPAVGLHNVSDALCAYTIVTRLGFSREKTARFLSGYRPSGMRENFVEKGGVLFIEDCYNAAPDSVRAAIDTVVSVAKGRKIAVLGDMLELGSDSEKLHFSCGRYAKKAGIDFLFTCGELAKAMGEGFGSGHSHFDSKDSLADYLVSFMKKGDTIVFKASRGMRFEDIIERVYEKRELT